MNEELKNLTGRLAILADRLKLVQDENSQQQEEQKKQEQKCARTGRSLECCQQAAAVARLRFLREKQRHLLTVAQRVKGLTEELVLAQLTQCKNELQFLMSAKGDDTDGDEAIPVPNSPPNDDADPCEPEASLKETASSGASQDQSEVEDGGTARSSARQDRVDALREEISQLEQQIIDLVYADEFEAADEAEKMRVALAEELEALEKENSSRLFDAN